MTIARRTLSGIAMAAALLVAGCAPASPTTATTSSPSAPNSPAAPNTPAASNTPAAPNSPAPPNSPAAEALAPVPYAAVTALTKDSVSWIDAKQIPAAANNVRIEPLDGAAHKHSAPLSPDATYFLPMDSSGKFHVGPDGLGTFPCDRAAMASWVVGNVNVAPRLTFDAQGRVTSMAARYHP